MSIESYQNHTPQLAKTVYVHPKACIIGDVTIGEDSSIWPMAVIRGDLNHIKIGNKTNIQDNCVLHITHDGPYSPGGFPLDIGDEVTIGHNAILHACTVGNQCLIGIHATVLDGAILEEQVLLGAGSLVPPGKTLESGFLYLGSPVKKIRPLTKKEQFFFRYSAENYVRLKNTYINNSNLN